MEVEVRVELGKFTKSQWCHYAVQKIVLEPQYFGPKLIILKLQKWGKFSPEVNSGTMLYKAWWRWTVKGIRLIHKNTEILTLWPYLHFVQLQKKFKALFCEKSCLVPGDAKLCTCRVPDKCDCRCVYIQLARSGTGQDVIPGASMWSRGCKCDRRCVRPSRLN